ncbi:MAG: DNA-3-methyladenine glycosylase [Halopseudomonas sp.]
MSNAQSTTTASAALPASFFQQDARTLAIALLGKVIRRRLDGLWLSARIIETEAYLLEEKGSHASLGFTEARRALFMDGGIIYMYYARGGDSMNCSAAGAGNGVLVKSAYPVTDHLSGAASLQHMQGLNPNRDGSPRSANKLCAGQTLLCRALGIRVPDWNARAFCPDELYIEDDGYQPEQVVQAARLGIPAGRDEDLPYRFIDAAYAPHCTRNPLGRNRVAERDYRLLTRQQTEQAAIIGGPLAG